MMVARMVVDMESWIRDIDKRLVLQERRKRGGGESGPVEGGHYLPGPGLVVDPPVAAATGALDIGGRESTVLGTVSVGEGVGIKVAEESVSLDTAYTDPLYNEVFVGPGTPPLMQEIWIDPDEPDPTTALEERVASLEAVVAELLERLGPDAGLA